MGKSDGIIKVFDGCSCMVRYFETVGIPKSASIEISVDDIRGQLTYPTLLPLLRKWTPLQKC
jgi:hypothetical protein